jgi:hypothetical protein
VKTVRIGCGAGFSGDRIDPAVELAEKGELHYLVFECLAERTIGLAQQAKARDPNQGYDPWLEQRMEAVLPACIDSRVRIVTNMGAANPAAAANLVRNIAWRLNYRGLPVATVTGDDVLEVVRARGGVLAETGERIEDLGDRLVSANAYIGAEPIVEALATGAAIVITGRVADPSLFVGPLAHEFGWRADDWAALGRGTLVGHLLECAGQITGGYFTDPGVKDVDGLSCLGFPLAEVPAHGPIVITKVAGSGGRVTPATCKEQLLYEIHDPSMYTTPDVIADFSHVRIAEVGRDRVEVGEATGRPRPDQFKVSLGVRDGCMGEGQISYTGEGALTRARLAGQIVDDRLRAAGLDARDIRTDIIGVNALHGPHGSQVPPAEVRLRVVARAASLQAAARVGREVEALYTNGPAGGAGATASTRDVLTVASTFVPRAAVSCIVHCQVA